MQRVIFNLLTIKKCNIMNRKFEKFRKQALAKKQMSKIKGGYHWEHIDGKWVLVVE